MASPKTGFEKWRDALSMAVKDEKWNAWDCEIQKAVNEYNHHLSGTAGYIPLDWQVIKAMLWVETGANHPEWNIKPMQIGVEGDPGLRSFLFSDEGGDMILPPSLKGVLTMGSSRAVPEYNIRAGIGYLLMRLANFEYLTVLDSDDKIYELTVEAGDSLDRIAKTHESTIGILRTLNPTANVLRPGQFLKYRKASVQRVITSWRYTTTTLIAQRYNVGGDPNYAKKLDHALTLVREKAVALCAP
jgi:hypothetical protein